MASKRRKQRQPIFGDLSPQARQAIGAVAVGVLGIFFVLSSFGGAEANLAGPAGKLAHIALTYLLGIGFILAPIACALYVYVLMRPRENGTLNTIRAVGIGILLISILGLLNLYDSERHLGGLVGSLISAPLSWLLGTLATGITLTAALFIGVFLTFNTGLWLPKLFGKKAHIDEDAVEEEYIDDEPLPEPEPEEDSPEADDADYEEEPADEEPAPKQKGGGIMGGIGLGKQAFAVSSFSGPYEPPPLSLLERDKGKARVGDTKANANIIKRTLQRFNIQVEMDEISVGPSVTRYTLKPAEGTRIAKIVNLQKELELALAAHPVRIEAPIPGKSLVGIEVPNAAKSMVGMASLLSSPEYTDSPKPLLITLGKDIAGTTHFANVAKLPHLLIAGATGAGKSVMIHSIITSLLFRNSPDQLRFIMVDPKRVELTNYNGIPHLLTPAITDPKKAILALKWATKEMERRYEILEAEKVRDIASYHDSVYHPARADAEKGRGKKKDDEEQEEMPESLPYIVIIIDELADIMQSYPRELESSIVRLTQKSRAVGIHVILATQRPEVKVITGLIKANVPGRIALRVNSQIDSRTILDQAGAEKLLGAGDMLFLSPDSAKMIRLQSAFISDAEMKRVVSYLKKQPDIQELSQLDFSDDNKENSDAFFESVTEDESDDELYEEAKDIVVKSGKASTSYLQRRLRIGYSRAARLVDILEERGIIGPADGARPREVLVRADGASDGESDEA